MQLTGAVSSLHGSCPDITFVVSGTAVIADASTMYRAGNCTKMESGQRVAVVGPRLPTGQVKATQIDLKP